jgi:NAD/NADP transhydrogenase alpha subunit
VGQTVFIPRETVAGEPRVAASPETVKRIAGLGLEIIVEGGAGEHSRIPDADFKAAGAAILLAMAFGFFTSAGFFSSTILFILICAVGWFILR